MRYSFLDHTPRGHAARYIEACYAGMRDDVTRTEAYRKAIMKVAAGKVVLDIGTGAFALLALFAAEAGAKHVYAIEVNTSAAEAAKRNVAEKGFADKVTVLTGFSTDSTLVLAAKADLIIHELIGEIAGEEGVVAAVVDAKMRHMSPDAEPPLCIPARACTMLAPCEYPDAAYCSTLWSPALLAGPGSPTALKLPAFPSSALLACAQICEDLRFEHGAPAASQRRELYFSATRAGLMRGLAMYIELYCAVASGDDEAPQVSSAWAGSHWAHIVLLLSGAVKLNKGQIVKVHATCELGGTQPQYTFETWLGEGGNFQFLEPAFRYPESSLNCNEMADMMTL